MTSRQLPNHQDDRCGPAVSAAPAGSAESALAAAGLRRVAVASVAALAVVLPLAAATAGSGHGDRPHKDTAHSAGPARPVAQD